MHSIVSPCILCNHICTLLYPLGILCIPLHSIVFLCILCIPLHSIVFFFIRCIHLHSIVFPLHLLFHLHSIVFILHLLHSLVFPCIFLYLLVHFCILFSLFPTTCTLLYPFAFFISHCIVSFESSSSLYLRAFYPSLIFLIFSCIILQSLAFL